MKTFLELIRIKVTLLVAFSAATGYILATNSLHPGFLYPFLGIAFLAAGATALNQIQERELGFTRNSLRGILGFLDSRS